MLAVSYPSLLPSAKMNELIIRQRVHLYLYVRIVYNRGSSVKWSSAGWATGISDSLYGIYVSYALVGSKNQNYISVFFNLYILRCLTGRRTFLSRTAGGFSRIWLLLAWNFDFFFFFKRFIAFPYVVILSRVLWTRRKQAIHFLGIYFRTDLITAD